MPFTKQEAQDALRGASAMHDRTARLQGYAKNAPQLFIWGAVWCIGFVASAFEPHASALIWTILIVLGCVAGYLIARRIREPQDRQVSWRYPVVVVLFTAFVAATYFIMGVPAANPRPYAAFPALLAGTIYAGAGLWLGWRIVAAGLLVCVLTVGGFILLPDATQYQLWMGGVGGAGLVLVGFWLRRV